MTKLRHGTSNLFQNDNSNGCDEYTKANDL